MSRFGILDRLREQSLAATGLALALTALVLGLLPGGAGARVEVLAVTHTIAAGGFVRGRDVASVSISASDRTPSMLASLGSLSGRRSLVRLAGGDFLLRGALAPGGRTAQLGRAERAVALELSPASAPDLRLLRTGSYVDVVVIDPAGSHVAARGLKLLAPASEQSGGIVVTVRAPAAVALALAAGRDGRELRLLLRGEPS